MKLIQSIAIILLPFIAFSCSEEEFFTQNKTENTPDAYHITVNANLNETSSRTSIQANAEGGFNFFWNHGDQIRLVEIRGFYEKEQKEDPYNRQVGYILSEGLNLGGEGKVSNNATFNFTIPAKTNPYNKQYSYIAVYQRNKDIFWASFTEDFNLKKYEQWYAQLGKPGAFKPHFNVMVNIPNHQQPLTDTFDPEADVLVSPVYHCEKKDTEGNYIQETETINFKFARVGSVFKMNLRGIPQGEKILSGSWMVGESFSPAYAREYDAELQATALFEKSPGGIEFIPNNIVSRDINGTIEAPIWLRTCAGKLSDYFELGVYTGENEGDANKKYYYKKVDLTGKSPIIFKDGKLTTINVTLNEYPFPSSVGILIPASTITHSTAKVESTINFGKNRNKFQEAYFMYLDYDGGYNPDKVLKEGTRVNATVNGNKLTATLTDLQPNTTYYAMAVVKFDEYETATNGNSFNTLKEEVAAEAIDLGLPSGTKWASYNVGATKPEEYGDYYAWGSLNPMTNFTPTWYNYPFADKEHQNPDLAYYTDSYCFTKYSTHIEFGSVDNKCILELVDDVVHQKWGGDWRYPTIVEVKELKDNCTATEETLNGVKGKRFTSKTNSNSIFIPYSGICYQYSSASIVGEEAYLWSSTIEQTKRTNDAGQMSSISYAQPFFISNGINDSYKKRKNKLAIRPVFGTYNAKDKDRRVYTNEIIDKEITINLYPQEGETENGVIYLILSKTNPYCTIDDSYETVSLYSEAYDNLANKHAVTFDLSRQASGTYYYRAYYKVGQFDGWYGETRKITIP